MAGAATLETTKAATGYGGGVFPGVRILVLNLAGRNTNDQPS